MQVLQEETDENSRELALKRFMAAMQRDMEGQRDLIDARAKGETDAVYWEGNQQPGPLPVFTGQGSAGRAATLASI